jgi:hypothetical protein
MAKIAGIGRRVLLNSLENCAKTARDRRKMKFCRPRGWRDVFVTFSYSLRPGCRLPHVEIRDPSGSAARAPSATCSPGSYREKEEIFTQVAVWKTCVALASPAQLDRRAVR